MKIHTKLLLYFGLLSFGAAGLFVLLWLNGLPVAGIEGLTASEYRRAIVSVEAFADKQRDEIERWFVDRRRDVRDIAGNEAFSSWARHAGGSSREATAAKIRLQLWLGRAKEANPGAFNYLYLIDSASGKLLAATEDGWNTAPEAHRLMLDEARTPGLAEFVYVVREGSQQTVIVTEQVVGQDGEGLPTGEIPAILVASMPLQAPLTLDAARTFPYLGDSGVVLLVNRDRQLLFVSSVRTETDTAGYADAVVIGSDGTVVQKNSSGSEAMMAFRSVNIGAADGFSLAAVRSSDEALAAIRANFLRIGGLVLTIYLLSIGLAVFAAHRLKKQDESLRAALSDAEAANRAKSNFLATMSHEIRTPMNGVLGMLTLLGHTDLTTRQADYAKKAESAAKALLTIINDILDFSKIEADKLELDNNTFALGDLLRDISPIVSANLQGKPIELLFALDPAVPSSLVGDMFRLRQVILNLIGNAIKFTERGEIVLSVRMLGTEVDSSGQELAEIEFSLQDSGIGIAPDKLAHIFQSFSQAESSTSRRFGGTGLGLTISKRLVGLMGGDLKVDSEPGSGSRFYFVLRLAQGSDISLPESANSAASGSTNPESGQPCLPSTTDHRPLRVLIVDDSAVARQVIEVMVQALGWQSESLGSGETALARLADLHSPAVDIVFIDWAMSGIDGWETVRRLRQQHQHLSAQLAEQHRPAIPVPMVIMVTSGGHDLPENKTKRELDLLDGYLAKPITVSMLHDAVLEARARRSGESVVVRPQSTARRLDGLCLLVVEDNLLNQQIALELLGHSGARVEIAGGGLAGVRQALDADPPFDAILMDMQMPDIDGLEATRRIRAEARMRSVPIIAMTANAMESDKEACRAAGMVDHISKPVDLEVLIETLRRHLMRDGFSVPADADQTVPGAPSMESCAEVVATARVNGSSLLDIELAVARLGGNRALYDQVLDAFRTDAPLQLIEAERFLAAHQSKDAIRCVHTLKGLAATIGARALSATAADLELRFKSGDAFTADELRVQMVEVEARLREVLAELDRGQASSSNSVPSVSAPALPLDGVALLQALSTLTGLLQTNNMRSLEVCAQIVESHSNSLSLPLQEQLARIDASVKKLSFQEALVQCDGLTENVTRVTST